MFHDQREGDQGQQMRPQLVDGCCRIGLLSFIGTLNGGLFPEIATFQSKASACGWLLYDRPPPPPTSAAVNCIYILTNLYFYISLLYFYIS